MSVSVNTSTTADIRRALSSNLEEAKRAGIALATGNAINHAYEDPTGLAIGSSMKAERDILSIVATGIEQSQSMLYIAEEGLKAAENIVNQMNGILARAKLGYMNDELIAKTLKPAYEQMKDELNRIADSVNFNGQKLLNGTGGIKTAGTASVINTTYNFSSSSSITLTRGTLDISGLDLSVTGSSLTGSASIDTSTSTGFALNNATYTKVGNNVEVTGDLVVRGVKLEDETVGTAKTATTDLTISGVKLTLTNPTLSSGSLVGNSNVTVDLSKATSYSLGAFTGTNAAAFTSAGISITPNTPSLGTTPVTAASISDITSTSQLSGGKGATSTFNFVTGTELNKDVIRVEMPNIRLNDKDGILGVISTLNTTDDTVSTSSSTLSSLNSASDVDHDIPLVKALGDLLVVYRNNLGAYQLRFINLQDQLKSSVEQVDNAQAAIMNADLPKNAEAASRAKVNLNLAIARLSEANHILENLQKIVTG